MTSAGTGEGSVLGGRYRLLRRLGRGGMAAVWTARDLRLEREVAVKVLSDVLSDDEDYRRRFEREAQVAAGLSHPGLVQVFDFGVESARPYLVMELVEGDTLAGRIAAGTTSELDLLALARELLGALGHIHAAGVVHRDVKPANVLLSEDGRARLTDFGIALPQDATALTETGEVIGTRRYMAPETQRGEAATPRSDLYALGLVLRECDPTPEPPLGAVIERLCATDPADRPASAGDALATLDAATAGGPGPSMDPTAPLPPTQPTGVLGRTDRGGRMAGGRRRRIPTGPLLAGLALLAAAALALALTSGGGDDAAPSDSGPARQSTEPSDTSSQRQAEPGSTASSSEPSSTAPATQPAPAPAPTVACSAIEAEKKRLEEEKKAAEKQAGKDKAAKDAVKNRFEADKKALEQRAKECK